MHKITKTMGLLLVCMLAGCATVNKAPGEKDDEKERKVKTAKINAQLGIAYLERHDLKRAKQKLLTSLQQAPGIPEPWYSMAYFLEATGNKTAAKAYYMKGVEVAPQRGDAHNNYGTYLCRMGEYRASIDEFKLAVADPDYLDPAGAYENAGTCAQQIPDSKLALYYFDRAVQQDPARTTSLLTLTELYMKVGDYKKARAALNSYDLNGAPSKRTQKLHDEIDKQIALQLAPHKAKVLRADLEKARTYKQVVSVTKQHGIVLTHDPLLPYQPLHADKQKQTMPHVITDNTFKSFTLPKPSKPIIAIKKPETPLNVGMVKTMRDYPNSKPFMPGKEVNMALGKRITQSYKPSLHAENSAPAPKKPKLIAQNNKGN